MLRDFDGDAAADAGREACTDLEAEQAAAEEHVVVALGVDERRDAVDGGGGDALGGVDGPDLRGADGAEPAARESGDVGADEDRVGLAAELAGERVPPRRWRPWSSC